jgi:hypothetical protein
LCLCVLHFFCLKIKKIGRITEETSTDSTMPRPTTSLVVDAKCAGSSNIDKAGQQNTAIVSASSVSVPNLLTQNNQTAGSTIIPKLNPNDDSDRTSNAPPSWLTATIAHTSEFKNMSSLQSLLAEIERQSQIRTKTNNDTAVSTLNQIHVSQPNSKMCYQAITHAVDVDLNGMGAPTALKSNKTILKISPPPSVAKDTVKDTILGKVREFFISPPPPIGPHPLPRMQCGNTLLHIAFPFIFRTPSFSTT